MLTVIAGRIGARSGVGAGRPATIGLIRPAVLETGPGRVGTTDIGSIDAESGTAGAEESELSLQMLRNTETMTPSTTDSSPSMTS